MDIGHWKCRLLECDYPNDELIKELIAELSQAEETQLQKDNWVGEQVRRCEDAGVQPINLDVTVHETAGRLAANVNNEGLEGQIQFLVDNGNERDTLEAVEDVIENLPDGA